MSIEIPTPCGLIRGNKREDCAEYLGIRYATAERFRYGKMVESWDGVYDATSFGPACPQYRQFFPSLDVPERLFYHREFREGQQFVYDEDCLNLNIYTPLEKGTYPVVIFVHGGGFNSLCNSESYLDGAAYAKRGVILVVINYRVGVFGYITDEEIQRQEGHDGNFALDDTVLAIKWVKKNIASFGGDPTCITMMGQSAGAISIQYLCLSQKAEGLFQRAIMMSGAGAFPKMGLPRPHEQTREYWKAVYQAAGVNDFAAFKSLSVKQILQAIEIIKKQRKDNQTNTMPVIDGYYLTESVDKLIKHPMKLDYLAGITNNDMFTIVLSRMAHKFTKKNNGYLYFFDVNAPGDGNLAFHSSDLRYAFCTLDKSWRPYEPRDYELSEMMASYFANFIKTGNPNGENLPVWDRGGKPLCIHKEHVKMGKAPFFTLLVNTFKGDPK